MQQGPGGKGAQMKWRSKVSITRHALRFCRQRGLPLFRAAPRRRLQLPRGCTCSCAAFYHKTTTEQLHGNEAPGHAVAEMQQAGRMCNRTASVRVDRAEGGTLGGSVICSVCFHCAQALKRQRVAEAKKRAARGLTARGWKGRRRLPERKSRWLRRTCRR